MKIFCTDLDNTIIYSYKHDIGNDKINVEIYEDKEISYITKKTHDLLNIIKKEYMIIPTTTRTIEQYKRINLDIGEFEYALVCNGGILLINGERDKEWYENSLDLIRESESELKKAIRILEEDSRRKIEIKFIEKLFIFTKCSKPNDVIQFLKNQLNTNLVDVFNNNEKIYIIPKNLNKGTSIKRLKEKLHPKGLIAAGDSEFDISMLNEADYGFVPNGFEFAHKISENIVEMESNKLFSDAFLEKILINYR